MALNPPNGSSLEQLALKGFNIVKTDGLIDLEWRPQLSAQDR